MTDPVTASLIFAGISGAGQIASSQAAARSSGFNSAIASENAGIASTNAALVGAQGESDVAVQGAKNKAQIGSTLANQGASGVDVNSGSAVDVRQSEAKIGMLNELNIRSQAAQRAYGFQTASASDKAQAAADSAQSSNDKTAGLIGAGTSILGGASQASMFSNLLSSGDPTGGITGGSYGGTAPMEN